MLPHRLEDTTHTHIHSYRSEHKMSRPAENREGHCDHMFSSRSVPSTSTCDSVRLAEGLLTQNESSNTAALLVDVGNLAFSLVFS